MDLARALLFLTRMVARPDPTPGQPIQLGTALGEIEADVYRPARPWATVVVLHGLALRGHRDPRLTAIGRALCAAGVCAIAPRIDTLARLRLLPPASDTIAAVLRHVRDRGELGAPARIGVFGPSYAGSQALVAASEPDLQLAVSSLALIGPYADARELMLHVLHDEGSDPYGRLILIRHFLEVAGDLTPGVARAIDADLRDQGLGEDPTLPAVLAEIDDVDRAAYLALRDDVEARERLSARILAGHAAEVDALSITGALPAVRAPVMLLHGAHDPVIPSSESARIHREVGGRSRIVTTALLDHGNVTAQGRALLDLPRVIDGFRWWFRALRRPA